MTSNQVQGPFNFAYSQFGHRNNSTSVFLHGFMGRGKDWDLILSNLCVDFHCIALDLPGHGDTPFPESKDFSGFLACSRAIITCLDGMGVNKCNLVGYSMGGRLALSLALLYPQRFHKVVVESGSPGLQTQAEREVRCCHDNRLAQRLESEDFQEVLQDWYKQPLFTSISKDPELFSRMFQSRMGNNPHGLARSLREMGTGMQPNFWPMLSQGQCPLLLIVGSEDNKFLRMAKEIARSYPDSKVVIAKGCGHNVHSEAPDFFTATVRFFLKH